MVKYRAAIWSFLNLKALYFTMFDLFHAPISHTSYLARIRPCQIPKLRIWVFTNHFGFIWTILKTSRVLIGEFRQKHSYWWICIKSRIRSLGIGCWIQWARISRKYTFESGMKVVFTLSFLAIAFEPFYQVDPTFLQSREVPFSKYKTLKTIREKSNSSACWIASKSIAFVLANVGHKSIMFWGQAHRRRG